MAARLSAVNEIFASVVVFGLLYRRGGQSGACRGGTL
jgi:hypothetical protein